MGDVLVVDINEMRERLTELLGPGGGRSDENTEILTRNLVDAFPENVLTVEQIASGDIDPRPLFYRPSTVKDATRMVSVKMAAFHTTPAHVLSHMRLRTRYPLDSGSQEQISCVETLGALYLFHPKYGDGFRDDHGDLYARDAGDRKYKKFSGSFFDGYGLHKNYFLFSEDMRGMRASDRSLREGLRAEFPHLIDTGLLNPERDVRQVTMGSESLEGRSFEHVGVSSSGSRMIRGVLHYIGKDLYEKDPPVRITELSSSIGCVIDESRGYPVIVRLFSIVPLEAARLSKNGSNSIRLANAKLTRPRAFSARDIGLREMPGETALSFDERCEAVDRGLAYLLLRVVKDHPSLAALLTSDNPSMLAEIGKLAYWLDKENKGEIFNEFATSYGTSGVRTFLSMEHNRGMGDKILEFANSSIDESLKKEIFELYGSIVDAGQDAESEQILNQIGKRAQQLLSRAHDFKEDPKGLRDMLRKLSSEGQVLLATFRALKLQGEASSVEDVSGVRYETAEGTVLARDAKQVEALCALYRSNYEPFVGEELAKEFKNNLNSPGAEVHRIAFKNKVVAFMLVVPTGEDRLHVSALNVDKELVGTSAGPVLIKKVLDLAQSGKIIEAEAVPKLADQYEKQFGFVKVGKVPDPLDPNKKSFLFKLELYPPASEPTSKLPQIENGEGSKLPDQK